jgi:hypothetical protein
MLHGSSHPGGAGSELTRLLAGWADAPAAPRAPFAERLGHWLGWTGAITLAAALNPRRAPPGAAARGGDEPAEFQRVRAALEASIAAGPDEPASSPTDFGPHRRHCLHLQQTMHERISVLRRRLREALVRRSAALARLAAIDGALEPALSAHERTLLALVPLRLQARFEHLQRSGGERWADTFRDDRARLLRAELAHRLLPAQGLLDALQTDESRR